VKKRLSFFTILVVFGLLGFLCACATSGSGLNTSKDGKAGQSKGSSLSKGSSGVSGTSGNANSAGKTKSVSGKKGIGKITVAGVIGFIPNKVFPFVKKNWLLILIILALCAACLTVCKKIRKKIKKLKQKILFITLTVLATVGLIGTALYFLGSSKTKAYFTNFPQSINKLEKKITKTPVSAQKSPSTQKPASTQKSVSNQKSSSTKTYVVIADTLNIRSGPSANYKIIGSLKKNETVSVVKNSGQWWRIKYKNIEGYVRSNYLKKK
jgi:DNA-binding HxlR family transcriptional regulator